MLPILIRAGFDTLEYAVPAKYPERLFLVLEFAKEQAAKSRKAQPVSFNGQSFLVEPGGGQGGYNYRITTGPFGAIIKIRDHRSVDEWSTHVKLLAHGLATKGVQSLRAETNQFLRAIGARFNHENTRISRLDYAMDFHAPNLHIDVNHFVAHPRTNKTSRVETTSQGDQISYYRFGQMPGRQICIYEKSRAIFQKNDLVWQEILSKRTNALGLEFSRTDIWRIECRAGRGAIDKCVKPRLFDTVLSASKNMYLETMQSIKWKVPTLDTNRSRWPLHPTWINSRHHLLDGFENFAPVLVSAETRRRIAENYILGLESQSEGLVLTLAAMHGVAVDEIIQFTKDHFEKIGKRLSVRDDLEDQLETRRARQMLMFGQ